ncbi:SKP1-like protein 11 [Lycium ferocissimum]|uniref:SKP1-like protein 11 n=1 Tax=Lycium ferocissimum TaxID=112874 RepID=UPI002816619B|nr:SKP1-like protein 11 [Lycium ferocissimum]
MSSEKLLTLKTSDGEEFVLEEAMAFRSLTIKNAASTNTNNNTPLSINVQSNTMIKVIEYWTKHSERDISEDQLMTFDKNFFKLMDKSKLFDLVLATNYLAATELLDAACEQVADRIRRKTPEEIRDFFNITREDEEQIFKELNN